jgi:hypothetical protein
MATRSVLTRAWLPSQPSAHRPESGTLTKTLNSYEKEIIEAALTETHGKVARAKGCGGQTWNFRARHWTREIKQLNIKKQQVPLGFLADFLSRILHRKRAARTGRLHAGSL